VAHGAAQGSHGTTRAKRKRVTWADGFEREGTSSPTLEGKGACMPCVEPDGPPLVGTQTQGCCSHVNPCGRAMAVGLHVNPLPLPPPRTVQYGWHGVPPHVAGHLGAAQHTAGLTYLFKGTFAGKPCTMLIDTGASFSFVDEGWLERNNGWFHKKDMLNIHSMDRPMLISAANDTLIKVDKEFHGLAVIQQARLPIKAKVMSKTLKGIDLIIGMEQLLEFDAHLSVGDGTCVLTVDGKTRTIRTAREFSGDGHIEKCSVAHLQKARLNEVLSSTGS